MIKKIGVIGAGQLAWMMAKESASLSLSLGVLPQAPNDPAVSGADYVAHSLPDLVSRSEVVTVENEFLDIAVLTALENEHPEVLFLPRLSNLQALVDKYQQRLLLQALNIPVPGFSLIRREKDIPALSFPVVLKLCTHGYDGKGTFILDSPESLFAVWSALGQPTALVESFIPFERELALMVARSQEGEIALYPIVETQQVDQVCRRVVAPSPISVSVQTEINRMARTIVQKLDYVGILGIEFFLTHNQQVLVNEMAPRPHNSGHYTIEGCQTSQFAQLLRAISGMPLGPTTMNAPVAVMVNLLGVETPDPEYVTARAQLAQLPSAFVHWYGKASRPGRKLGHVTALVESYDRGADIINQIESLWYAKAPIIPGGG